MCGEGPGPDDTTAFVLPGDRLLRGHVQPQQVRRPAGGPGEYPDRGPDAGCGRREVALHSLQVHTAGVTVADGIAVLTFAVTPRFGGLPDPALVRSDLVRVLGGSLELGGALARKERDYAPATPEVERTAPARVLWFDDEATGAVVLELRGTDRIGLLHHVTVALERSGVDLVWARVETLGSSVVDAFGIAGTPDRAARTEIERAVLTVAAGPVAGR